jgi:hypothetical protein
VVGIPGAAIPEGRARSRATEYQSAQFFPRVTRTAPFFFGWLLNRLRSYSRFAFANAKRIRERSKRVLAIHLATQRGATVFGFATLLSFGVL